jgi:FkbM family methyltransferase
MPSFNVPYIVAEAYGETHHVPEEASHRPASKCLLGGSYYEPSTHRWVKERLEKKPGNMIHAGTFFGDMLPSFSKAVGEDYMLYAFEPVLNNYVLAKLTVEANNLANVFLQNSALNSKFELLKIKTRDGGGTSYGGGSTISTNGNELITAITIDSLGLSNVSLIHLDVELHELKCLIGAKNTIDNYKPMIMVEDHKKTTTPLLKGLGYTNTHGNHDQQCWVHFSDLP